MGDYLWAGATVNPLNYHGNEDWNGNRCKGGEMPEATTVPTVDPELLTTAPKTKIPSTLHSPSIKDTITISSVADSTQTDSLTTPIPGAVANLKNSETHTNMLPSNAANPEKSSPSEMLVKNLLVSSSELIVLS